MHCIFGCVFSGGSAGSLFGVGNRFINTKNLKIFMNGGVGMLNQLINDELFSHWI